ncbi:MAG: leucine--tRNA ligase [Beutenbergiaceae bacterium]
MTTEPSTDEPIYDAAALQDKWLPVWQQLDAFRAGSAAAGAEKRYALTMFPYPSGDLHMGHAEVFALHDVLARYWWLRGYDVLNPIGWDSFGLPAENAAIRKGVNPRDWTYANIETQAESIRRYGVSFDWSRRLHTSDPEYYRWTQWLFQRFYERGLAYRKASPVNWCPQDQTVLANEQVVGGQCERCGAVVTKRELTQWFFKVTDYAQRLLDDMEGLRGTWPERVLTMQKNWIGRSEGAHVEFVIEGRDEPVTVFTTRPDTLFGATFFVVAADAPLATELATPEQQQALTDYVEQVRRASDIERLASDRPKTGVFLGRYAINPVNGAKLPIWAADYVLADYGTGAIMAVPGGDERDFAFAQAHDLPVIYTVATPADFDGGAYTGSGPVINSSNEEVSLDGLGVDDAKRAIIDYLERHGTGTGAINFRLRDWLLSRQRFWGAPIPIIHCPECGEVAVPADQLPVRLPDLTGDQLKPEGGLSPVAKARDWVTVPCPQGGGTAQRDTETMDTFVESSGYFLRYCSPGDDDQAFDGDAGREWMPAPHYVGGVQHALLHRLSARVFTKVLSDLGMIDFHEPFSALLNQGQVINEGKAMSKSLGNGVDLGQMIDEFGVDAVRLTLVFAGPPEDDIDWADMSPGGSLRFLQRAWRLAGDVSSAVGTDPATGDRDLRALTHKTLRQAEELVESHRFNVVVARTMELVNNTRKAIDSGPGGGDPAVREAVEAVAILLSLVAPYTAEEMWERLDHQPTIGRATWPQVDESLLAEETMTAIVQIMGKVRARLEVSPDISEADLQQLALDAVVDQIEGKTVRRVIVRPPSLVNLVVG